MKIKKYIKFTSLQPPQRIYFHPCYQSLER